MQPRQGRGNRFVTPFWLNSVMRILTIIPTCVLAVSLTACAVTQASLDPNSERTVTRSFKDITASRAIKARMLRVEGFDLNDVSIDVAEGIVVLAGAAPRDEDRIEAERIAWSAPGVRQVGNEIKVGQSAGLMSKTKDDLIATAVRTRLATSNNVRNLNYTIETREGVVYLLGVARTQDELAEAARLASITRGVKEVVSYVTIRGDMPNAYNAPAQPSVVAQRPISNPQNTSDQGLEYWGTPVSGGSTLPAPDLPDYSGPIAATPIPLDPQAPLSYRPGITELDPDALDSGEPFLRDPITKEKIEIPEGTTVLPYIPDGPGSLGAGGIAPPVQSSPTAQVYGVSSAEQNAALIPAATQDNRAPSVTRKIVWDGVKWVQATQ